MEDVNESAVKNAVEFAEFNNMKKMEARGEFNTSILKPTDPNNSDSFKVRKGVVGGYVNYFSDDEIMKLGEWVRKLDPFFKYNSTSPDS